MNRSQVLSHAIKWVLPAALGALVATAVAQFLAPAPPAIPARELVTLSLDRDLVTFIKWGGGAFGVFLLLCGWVFGVDVLKTRTALMEAREDIASRREAIQADHQVLLELKERLLKLGAEMTDQVEKKSPPLTTPTPKPDDDSSPDEATDDTTGALSKYWMAEERKKEILRQTIAASEFEWSTLDTLHRKTGISKAELMALANTDPLIQRGIGRNGNVLFRMKEFNYPIGGAYAANKLNFVGSGSLASKAFRSALWDHAQEGKPTSGNVLGGG